MSEKKPRFRNGETFFGVYLDTELKAALEKLAAEDDRTMSSYIRTLLKQHIASKKG